MFIAGRDTTACLMSWAISLAGRFLLVRHPSALAKLRSQIAFVIPDRHEVTRAHIAKISFPRCVINESTFLYISLSATSLCHITYLSQRIASIPTTD
ncbi:Cytochrome P450 [Lachnellula cervina]|uniref:Cytochrome P450 n=1 Tax=Lachnellula cervina TaxID=1316786 RepID=A0A7D8UU18_9HELO|nr:Cytochrome P450 [Lachnellula cervina]